jgi:hypothetical protein
MAAEVQPADAIVDVGRRQCCCAAPVSISDHSSIIQPLKYIICITRHSREKTCAAAAAALQGFYVFIRALQLLRSHNEGVVLVGLGGASGSGKTAFSEKVSTAPASSSSVSSCASSSVSNSHSSGSSSSSSSVSSSSSSVSSSSVSSSTVCQQQCQQQYCV